VKDPQKLFEPVSLGNLSLPNRIAMAPMTRNASPNNIPNDANIEYYRKRAAAGVGLIITEGTCVNHPGASGYPNVPYFYGEDRLAGWKKVVDAVHAEGGKIAPQLWHVGAVRKAGTPPEGDVPGYGPSGMNVPGKQNRHVMTESDIADVISAFAEGARDAKAIGCDAVELHCAHGYLPDQFLWEGTNQRADQYGGSMENRARFVVEIIKACRAEVGTEFPVIMRWSQWKQQDYKVKLVDTPEQLETFLSPFVDAGVDVFHCSTRRFWEPEFEGSDLNLAGWAKKLTGKPTITVGSVGLNADFLPQPGETAFRSAEPASLDELISRIENNEFDVVAVGRALIANPEWPALVKAGRFADLESYSSKMLMSLK